MVCAGNFIDAMCTYPVTSLLPNEQRDVSGHEK